MSYLMHLAARALGRAESAIEPVLAPYFAPEGRGLPGIATKDRGQAPPAQPGVLLQRGAAPPSQADAPARLPGERPGATSGAPDRAVQIEQPAALQPAPAQPAPAPAANLAAPLPTGSALAHAMPERDRPRGRREHGAVTAASRTVLVTRAARSRPSDVTQPTAVEPPAVHIRIGRVEIRAVPAPQNPTAPSRGASSGRTSDNRGSTSLEEYLAGTRGGAQ